MHLFTSFHQYIKKQPCDSLLSVSESLALKGLLIILVVLGHNTYLMSEMYAYKFLYSFHVYAFFYLPFLYNYKRETLLHCISKNLVRLYIPYTFAFVLLLAIYLKTNSDINYGNILLAYISGSTHHFLGIGGFLWFVPTLFSLLLIKQLYYKGNFICRYMLLVLSLWALICFSFGYLGLWQIYQPFRCMTAMAMLLPAVVIRFMIENFKLQQIGLVFFIAVILAFIIYPGNYFYEYTIINRFLFPVIIFLFLYSLRKNLAKLRYLIQIGKYSFPIYIFHVFIYQCFYLLIDRYLGGGTLYWGIIIFVLTGMASYAISQMKIVNRLFKL